MSPFRWLPQAMEVIFGKAARPRRRGQSSKRATARLRLEGLEGRLAPAVTVAGSSPALAGGTLPAAATALQIDFSAAVVGGADAGNYALQRTGPDGLLGTADDVSIALTAGASGAAATLTFAPLPEGVYRLRVRDTITDTVGNQLDGDGNGLPGGDFLRDVVVEPAPKLNLTSPNAFTFDVEEGGFGAGQLVQGSGNVFDGLNRLQVGGADYAPATLTTPGADFTTLTVPSSSMVTPDDAYHDVAGFTLSFTADGGPVGLGALLQVTNFASGDASYFFRLLVDGAVQGLEGYLTLALGAYGQVSLEAALAGLSAGTHTVKVQARANQGLRVDTGTLTARQFHAIPNVGPGTDLAAVTVASSSMVTPDSVYHDVAGFSLTFAADGANPVRLDGLLQATNFAAAQASYFFRLLVDGAEQGTGRYLTLARGFYGQVRLEALLTGLSAGSHTVKVQALADQGLRVDTGTLTARQFHAIPNVGPGADFAVATPASSSMVTPDDAYHDVAGLSLTFAADGVSVVRLGGLLQATNFASGDASYFFRLLLDGALQGSEGYLTLSPGFYGQVGLEAVLTGLSAGSHTVKVQARANQALRVDTGTLSALQLHPFPDPTLEDAGRTLVTPTQSLSGLNVHREITVPGTGGQDFARTVDVFTNPSLATTIATSVRLVGNLGSGAGTTIFATSNGNTTADAADRWIGTDDADGAGSPAVIHYVHGPGGLQPTTVEVTGDNIAWTYAVTLAPGQTLRLATFTVLSDTRAGAVAAAEALVTSTGFGGQAAAFLSAAELDTLGNFSLSAGAGGPYTVAEGGGLTLQAGPSFNPNGHALTYLWDLNGDGVFGDASGASPALSALQLQALGLGNGPALAGIRVQVGDNHGHLATSTATTLTIANAPPQVLKVVGPARGARGKKLSYTAVVSDAGSDAVTYRWRVTRKGKQVAVGFASRFKFRPKDKGIHVLTLQVTDQDGGVSTVATLRVKVSSL